MLNDLVTQINNFYIKAQHNIPIVLIGIGILWILNFLNWGIGSKLNAFGLIPRKAKGIPGIFISPFLHKGFNHLFFNSIPLFILVLFALDNGIIYFYKISGVIFLGTGLLVWCIGRSARHIGASGVISGYYGYVLANAFIKPTITSVLLAFIALYYFAGILLGVLPSEDKVSWESHLFGFITGIFSIDILSHISRYI